MRTFQDCFPLFFSSSYHSFGPLYLTPFQALQANRWISWTESGILLRVTTSLRSDYGRILVVQILLVSSWTGNSWMVCYTPRKVALSLFYSLCCLPIRRDCCESPLEGCLQVALVQLSLTMSFYQLYWVIIQTVLNWHHLLLDLNHYVSLDLNRFVTPEIRTAQSLILPVGCRRKFFHLVRFSNLLLFSTPFSSVSESRGVTLAIKEHKLDWRIYAIALEIFLQLAYHR